MIEVEALAPQDSAAWEDFVTGRPGALIYHSTRYRDLLVQHLDCEPEYLIATEGGEIRGVLPALWASEGGSRVLNSLPYYGSHGAPVAETAEVRAKLIEAWDERATDRSTSAATMVGNPFLAEQPPEPAHTLTDERISQVTTLPADPSHEAVMELIRPEARRNVRKAAKLGVTAEHENDALDALYEIHVQNMEAIGGLAKSKSFFDSIASHMRAGQEYDHWLARLDGEVVAALLVLRYNGVVEYFTSGTVHDYRTSNPHSTLLVEAMVNSIEKGCRLWNWGGTWLSQTGVYRFKRKWAAEESRYRYFVQLNDEGLLDLSPAELRGRFPHFFVVPFSVLNAKGGQK